MPDIMFQYLFCLDAESVLLQQLIYEPMLDCWQHYITIMEKVACNLCLLKNCLLCYFYKFYTWFIFPIWKKCIPYSFLCQIFYFVNVNRSWSSPLLVSNISLNQIPWHNLHGSHPALPWRPRCEADCCTWRSRGDRRVHHHRGNQRWPSHKANRCVVYRHVCTHVHGWGKTFLLCQ